MFKPNIAIAGAVTGFVLSALAGFIAGNPLGIVLFRAVLMAILLGGLASVLAIVLGRFLPELEDSLSAESPGGEASNMVDITVGEQGEQLNPFAQAASDGATDESQVPDFLLSGRPGPEEDLAAPREAGAFPGEAESSPGRLPESPPKATKPATQSAQGAHAHSSGGLDVLPELDDFVPAKRDDGDDDEPEGFNASEIVAGAGSLGGGVLGGDNDSATMANAIRTILTREP